jgi:hypothetical protein
MNKKPVVYMQTDARWKDKPYQTTGETTTIGKSGCGPTCAAMLIETLTGKTYTPVDACAWSIQHGYKALNQGTYYSYFTPQFKAFGIDCKQLNGSNLYGNSTSPVHDQVVNLLKQGYYMIACMGKGNWTSSGHFIVVWWQDGKVRINDPASTKEIRLNGDISTFRSQVKYYFSIDAREYNGTKPVQKGDDEDVDVNRFKELWQEMRKELQDNDSSAWSQEPREWAIQNGIVQGGGNDNYMWQDVLDREQMVTLLYRFAKLMGKA